MDGWMDGWRKGGMDGGMGRTDGRSDRWMDGRIDRKAGRYVFTHKVYWSIWKNNQGIYKVYLYYLLSIKTTELSKQFKSSELNN